MKNILIVEDSDVVVKVLRHLMSQSHDYQPVHTTSFAQVKALLDHTNNPNSATSTSETQIFGALVDCQLSDAPNGEILDYLLSKKIPTILFAGADDLENCEQYFQKGIVDYVMKEGRHAYKNAINIITRLEKNQGIKVMVVDESEKSRVHIVKLLSRHLFQVVEAKDGMDAIKILLENPDIKLLFTDHDMRRMDDFELIRNLRHKYDQTELVIIGITSSDSRCSSAQYIKHGANDFLVKPFQPEEFYYRVNHNIELLESNERVAHASQQDHLTGLFHRQYFFNAARDAYTQSEEKSSPLALAIISVDQFHKINEKHGHEWEDIAIQHVADILQNMLGRFLLCRADSSDFYVLLPGLDNEKAVSFISRVRQLLSAEECNINGVQERFYFSSGVSNKSADGIDKQIKKSSHLLRLAKEAGGNMVLGDDDEESQ